jgi:hypothetical protein
VTATTVSALKVQRWYGACDSNNSERTEGATMVWRM